ncbi:unnamed protein product [Polarella glacialis]|uniref:Uncharacterized protein n=1 Tax=Polarella glacialis TaxID=89957 RepID=A0A813GQP6_POLGL|nr:unnamed protein product [Polarella glacialis]
MKFKVGVVFFRAEFGAMLRDVCSNLFELITGIVWSEDHTLQIAEVVFVKGEMDARTDAVSYVERGAGTVSPIVQGGNNSIEGNMIEAVGGCASNLEFVFIFEVYPDTVFELLHMRVTLSIEGPTSALRNVRKEHFNLCNINIRVNLLCEEVVAMVMVEQVFIVTHERELYSLPREVTGEESIEEFGEVFFIILYREHVELLYEFFGIYGVVYQKALLSLSSMEARGSSDSEYKFGIGRSDL